MENKRSSLGHFKQWQQLKQSEGLIKELIMFFVVAMEWLGRVITLAILFSVITCALSHISFFFPRRSETWTQVVWFRGEWTSTLPPLCQHFSLLHLSHLYLLLTQLHFCLLLTTCGARNLTQNYKTYLARVPWDKWNWTPRHTKFIPFSLRVGRRRELKARLTTTLFCE